MEIAERTQQSASGVHRPENFRPQHPSEGFADGFQENFQRLVDNVSSVVVTSPHNVRLALLGLFAQGHILLDDLPGVGKTLMAKTIADSIDGSFSRIQFTSDLLPSDITGTTVFDMRNQTFEFVPGPVFANVVIADEINRAGPRTQGALLEAMAEGQVTADGKRWPLPAPFLIIATQNLVESHGTFPLPNSQLDRFLVSMSMGLPSPQQEMEILSRSEHGSLTVQSVITAQRVNEMRQQVLAVEISQAVKQYLVNLAAATRDSEVIAVGVSPRGSAALVRASQAWAAFHGRDFVVPEDIQELAPNLWGHRIVVRPEAGAISGPDAVQQTIESVAAPL